jgi:hypothetical protein
MFIYNVQTLACQNLQVAYLKEISRNSDCNVERWGCTLPVGRELVRAVQPPKDEQLAQDDRHEVSCGLELWLWHLHRQIAK